MPDALPLAATNAETPILKSENVGLSKETTEKALNDVKTESSRRERKAILRNDATDGGENNEAVWAAEPDDEADWRLDGFFDVYVDWDYESDFGIDDDE